MNKTTIWSLASIWFATLLILVACSNDDNGNNPSIPLPSSGSSGKSELCNGVSYDPSIYDCKMGELIGSCKGKDYYVAYEQCDGGVVVDKGGGLSSSRGGSSSNITPSSSSGSSSVEVNNNSSSSSAVEPTVSSSSLATSSNSSSVYYSDKGNDISNYKTITIGDQIWMAENLNYDVPGSKCYGEGGVIVMDIKTYDTYTITLSDAEIQSYCNTHGRLYDWATAMALDTSCNHSSCSGQVGTKHRGVCPEGWHIPSNADWDKLMRYVDGSTGTSSPYISTVAGKYLKTTSGWNSYNGIVNLDTYGFSAIPSQGGLSVGAFNFVIIDETDGKDVFSILRDSGYWWSASENNNSSAYSRVMYYHSNRVGCSSENIKDNLYSVRCIND